MSNRVVRACRRSALGLSVCAFGAVALAQPQVAGPPSIVATAGQRLISNDSSTNIASFGSLASDGARIAASVTLGKGSAIASFTPGSSTVQVKFRIGSSIKPVGGHTILSFERGFGIGASGALVASALTSTGKPTVGSGKYGLLDTLWLIPPSGTATLVAARTDKFSPSDASDTRYWTFASHAGVSDSGTPYWIGGRTSDWNVPTNDMSLYRGGGTNPVRLIGSGSGVVGGLFLDARHPLRLAFLTPSGSRIYGVFGLAAGTGVTTSNDEVVGWREAETPTALVRVLLREGDFLSGTAGERWKAFDRMAGVDKSLCPGTNEWGLLARTNTDSYRDSVLVVNGQIVLREGDTVDGRTLLGDARELAMNRQGDWAVLWKVRETAPTGGGWLDRSALIINGRTALLEQVTAVGGANVTTLDGPICLGDRSMTGYAEIGVVGSILPTAAGAVQTAAILDVHAMTGLAGCCPADLATGDQTVEGETPDGQVTPADLALFITWYMALDPRADLDNGAATGTPDGQFTEADLNYYLNHYFTGCLEAI